MQLIKFDPFRSLLDDNFAMPSIQKGLKIHETDKSIVVEAVVAGIPKNDVEIEIEDGVLTVKAETKRISENKSSSYDEVTSSAYQYYYTTALSGGQWDKAEAEVSDGVVTIDIPKAESARPRKITVKTS